MTATRVGLFTEMNAAAEAMEHDLRVASREDLLQIEFRQIQKARMQDLSTVEWLALFGASYDEYMAGIEAERAAARTRITTFIEQRARARKTFPLRVRRGRRPDGSRV